MSINWENLANEKVERMGLKFLKIMEVEWNWWNPLSGRYYNKESFQQAAAQEIIDKLFTEPEKNKLKSLIKEYGGISLEPVTASNLIGRYIARHLGTTTGKIFRNIQQETVSPEALQLLGLINLKKEHFLKSYPLFARLLTDLGTERGPHYQMATVKGYFTKALGELESLVKSLKEAKEGKGKPNQENSTNSANKIEPEEAEEEENDQTKDTSEEEDSSPDQNLEKLRKEVIAEIDQAMQEAQITEQDLVETDRQWKILVNNNAADYINQLRENLLAVIQQKKKEKGNDEELSKLIHKGEQTSNPAELKSVIEQIEGFRGEKVYDTLKEKINALKKKLAEQDLESYRHTIYQMVEQELKDEGVKENELDAPTQKNLEKLKKGGIQPTEIDAIKDEVSNNIKLNSAKIKLEKLLEDYQNNPSSAKRKEIIAFIKSSNSFHQDAYRDQKDKVDSLLKNDSAPKKEPPSESNFPTSAKYIIGGMTVVAVIFLLVEIVKKKRPYSRRV